MFDNTFYKQIIDSSPIGYAYHKILCDERVLPYDYEYIEVNAAFEELTGLNRKYIIGKTISKVLPGILKSEFDWIAYYGEVALNRTEKTFEQYSEPLKKWYRVNAFSPEQGYFATTFVDITNEKEQIEDLSKVLETSDEYLDYQHMIDYQKTTDRIMELADAKVASFNIYDENGDTFRTVAISADSKIIRKGTEFLGISLEGKVWNHDPVRAEKIKNQTITRFNKLSDLTGDVIPSAVVDLLVKSFGLGETVLVKIEKDDRMIGDFTLIMEKAKPFDKEEICKIYAKQLGLAIEIKRSEKNLSSSRQEYMSLVENTPGAVYRCLNNKNWTMLMMSQEVENVTGYHSDNFIRDQEISYVSIIHPEDVERVSNEIQKTIATDKPWSIDYRIVHKDGHTKWVYENGRGIKNEEGDIVYLDGIILDITKQKKTEEELKRSKEELNKYFTSSLDMLCIANTKGEFIRLNPEWEKVLGFSIEELEGQLFLDFVHPDDLKATSKAIKDLENQQEVILFTNRYRCKDGTYRWIEWRSKPVNTMIYAVARDITDRIKLQERLSDSERQYRLLAENMADVVWTTDLKLNTTWVSPSIYHLTGETPEEHMTTNIQDRFSQNDFMKLSHLFQQQLLLEEDPETDKKRFVEIELQHGKKDGSSIWVSMKMTFLRGEHGRPIGIHGVTRDISEKFEKDQAIQKQNDQQEILLSASEKLINAVSENLSSAINSALSEVAKIAVADRVYLFEHDYSSQVTNNTYEWCGEDIVPQIEILKSVPFSEFEEWLYFHRKGESIVINDVQALPEGDSVREILEPQGIKSLLSVPVFFEGELFGFIGFDSVRQHHLYTKEEQAMLHQFANNLVIMIKKDRYISMLISTENRIRVSEERFRKLFYDVSSVAVQGYKEDGTVTYWNKASELIYGYKEKEALGNNLVDLIVPNEIKDSVIEHVTNMFNQGYAGNSSEELLLKHKNGDLIPVYSNHVVIKMDDSTRELFCLDVDLSKQKNIEKQLFMEKELFKTTLLSVGDGIVSTDDKGKVLILNPIAEQLTGWTQEEAFEKPIEEVLYIVNEYTRERCDNPVHKVLETGEIIELATHSLLISKDGIERPIEDSAAPIKDDNGEITGVVLVFSDFTEKKKNQDEIKYLSFHDHLTGLYNRRFFEAEMERLDTERNLPVSIIIGDVNGLKLINDTFGHSVGDELLIKGTKIIKNCLRADDIVARVGGDEVAILLPKTPKSEVETLIKRIRSELKEEKIKDMEVSISFGWETKTNSAESLALVLKKAEDYMYNNKLFEGPSIRGKTIENIIATINAKSPREKAHSERVSKLCVAIGRALNMDEKDLSHLKALGLFHDVGKIAISDDILNKPDKLTDREYKEICRHAEIGYRILSATRGMTEIAEFVLYHHERWDGEGYPKGLKGEEIPLSSRICALADAYDAMTSDRSYRFAMSEEYAIEELRKNSGTQFDPDVVDVFINKVLPKLMKEEKI